MNCYLHLAPLYTQTGLELEAMYPPQHTPHKQKELKHLIPSIIHDDKKDFKTTYYSINVIQKYFLDAWLILKIFMESFVLAFNY